MSGDELPDEPAPGGYPTPTNPAVACVAVLGFAVAAVGLVCGGLELLGGALLTPALDAQKAGALVLAHAALYLLAATTAIPAGIGLLQRRKWGRTWAFIAATAAAVAGPMSPFVNGVPGLVPLVLLGGYAVATFLLLPKLPPGELF